MTDSFSQFSLENLRHTFLLNIVISPVSITVEMAWPYTRLVSSVSSDVDYLSMERK